MSMEAHRNNINILTSLSIHDLFPIQLSRFTADRLLARITGHLDPLRAATILHQSNGRKILTFDIGGTAIKWAVATVDKHRKVIINDKKVQTIEKIGDGSNYADVLLTVEEKYKKQGMPVAISTGGLVKNNELIDSANFPGLVKRLDELSNFKGIFGRTVRVMNDAEAGVITAAVADYIKSSIIRPIIYLISGGGLGGAAVDKEGNIISLEPGHLPIIDQSLNPYGVSTRCDFQGNDYVCLERVGASGAGIEAQWEKMIGTHVDCRLIAEEMYKFNNHARRLYDNSANIISHILAGIINALNFPDDNTAIVLHGGGFKTKGMVSRINQILSKHFTLDNVNITTAGKLGYKNACMAGLAIVALINETHV